MEVYVRREKPLLREDAAFLSTSEGNTLSNAVVYVKREYPQELLDAGGTLHVKFSRKDKQGSTALQFKPLFRGASVVGSISAGSPLDLREFNVDRIGFIGHDARGVKVINESLSLRPPVMGWSRGVQTLEDTPSTFTVEHNGPVLIKANIPQPLRVLSLGPNTTFTQGHAGGVYVEATGYSAGETTIASLSGPAGNYNLGLTVEPTQADPSFLPLDRVGKWNSGPVVSDDKEAVLEALGAIPERVSVDGKVVAPVSRVAETGGGKGGGSGEGLWAIPLAVAAIGYGISEIDVDGKKGYLMALPTTFDVEQFKLSSKGTRTMCAVPSNLVELPMTWKPVAMGGLPKDKEKEPPYPEGEHFTRATPQLVYATMPIGEKATLGVQVVLTLLALGTMQGAAGVEAALAAFQNGFTSASAFIGTTLLSAATLDNCTKLGKNAAEELEKKEPGFMDDLGELLTNPGGSMEQLGTDALNTATNAANTVVDIVIYPGTELGILLESGWNALTEWW